MVSAFQPYITLLENSKIWPSRNLNRAYWKMRFSNNLEMFEFSSVFESYLKKLIYMEKHRQSKSKNIRGVWEVAKVPCGHWEGDCIEVSEKIFHRKAVLGGFHKKTQKWPKFHHFFTVAHWECKNLGKINCKIIWGIEGDSFSKVRDGWWLAVKNYLRFCKFFKVSTLVLRKGHVKMYIFWCRGGEKNLNDVRVVKKVKTCLWMHFSRFLGLGQ